MAKGAVVNGVKVAGGIELLSNRDFLNSHVIIIGVGDCKTRGVLSRLVKSYGGKLANVFHPSAIVSRTDVRIGDGTAIMPFALIGPNVRIGEYCIVNNRATIAHDSIVENGVNVSDGACFTATVGEEAWIGLNVSIIPKVRIGARSIVGAGSVVTREVKPDTTVAGVPARFLRMGGTHGVVA